MRKRMTVSAVVVGMSMFLALPSVGAQAGATQAVATQAAPKGAEASGTIRFDVTMHAHAGKDSMFPLSASAFTVTDNKKVVTPLQFRAIKRGQEAIQVLLLLDTVNIQAKYMGSVKEQLVQFLRSNKGALLYPTSLLIGTDTGTSTTPFTGDGNHLADTLEKQTIPVRGRDFDSGTGAIEDRRAASLQRLIVIARGAKNWPGRTVILWISPGWEYRALPRMDGVGYEAQSFKAVVEFSTQMRTSHITMDLVDPVSQSDTVLEKTFYQDFLKSPRKQDQVQDGDTAAQVLATQSGGRVVVSNDLAGGLQQCLDDLREYYELTIPTGPADGPNTYHHLEVKVSEPGLTVQTRDGYYAQP